MSQGIRLCGQLPCQILRTMATMAAVIRANSVRGAVRVAGYCCHINSFGNSSHPFFYPTKLAEDVPYNPKDSVFFQHFATVCGAPWPPTPFGNVPSTLRYVQQHLDPAGGLCPARGCGASLRWIQLQDTLRPHLTGIFGQWRPGWQGSQEGEMVNNLYLTWLVRARFFFKNSGLIWDTWNSLEDLHQSEALKPFWKIISWIFDESTVLVFFFFFS